MAVSFAAVPTVGSAAGDYTADLTGLNTGDDMLVAIFTDIGATPIPTPSGWTVLQEDNNSGYGSRQLFWRKRQAGDSSQLFDVAGGGSYARIFAALRGGLILPAKTAENANAAAANTVLPAPALTVAATSMSLMIVFWAGASSGVGPGSGYVEAGESTRVWMGSKSPPLTPGSLTPSDAIANSGVTNRYGIHVEYQDLAALGGGAGMLLGVG